MTFPDRSMPGDRNAAAPGRVANIFAVMSAFLQRRASGGKKSEVF